MHRSFLIGVSLVFLSAGLARGQAPDSLTIEQSMNESLELEFTYFQELANVQIMRGGVTTEDEYLFLCTADLVWKLSSFEFAEIMQQEIIEEATPVGDDDMLWRALNVVLADKLERIGEFEAGDPVMLVRFRVRLEQAGTDWIVTEAKIRETDRNPLNIIDKGEP